MRKLGIKDAFSLARIIKNAGIKNELAEFGAMVMERRKKGEETPLQEVGVEAFLTMVSSFADEKIEQEFYKLYADIKGVSAEEVSLITPKELAEDVKEIISENDLKSFFRSASIWT